MGRKSREPRPLRGREHGETQCYIYGFATARHLLELWT